MSEKFELYGRTYDLAPLDEIEMAYFNQQFETLFGVDDSIERRIMMDRKDMVITAIRAVKAAIVSKPTFRGLNPGDTELGFSPIRPVHVKRAGLLRSTWEHAVTVDADRTADSWADWLVSTGAGVGYTLDKRMGQVILYLKSFVSPTPFVSAVKFKVGRTELVPFPLRSIKLGDNEHDVAIYPVPTVFVMPGVDSLYVDLLADKSGTEELALGGLTIGLGAFLKETTSVTWQT